MQNNLYTACDACVAVLEGKQGTANVKKNYLIVRNIGMYYAEDDRVVWAARRDDMTQLHFCNGNCLQNYLDAKREQLKNHSSIFDQPNEGGEFNDNQ